MPSRSPTANTVETTSLETAWLKLEEKASR